MTAAATMIRVAFMSISLGMKTAARRPPPNCRLRHVDVVVLQWERADTLARRLGVGMEPRRRRHADGRLADAAPDGPAGRHDDRFHLRHFGDAHGVVVIEILLFDAAV